MNYYVKQNEVGMTAFKYVSHILKEAPKSFIYKLFKQKDIKINGLRAYEKTILALGDEVYIYIKDDLLNSFISHHNEIQSYNVKSMIVYEDDFILIIDKPRGLLVQKDHSGDIALDDMVRNYLNINSDSIYKSGPAHRLDRNTGGLIIFAKTYLAAQELFMLLKDKNAVKKHYLVLVKGKVDKPGIINYPLIKNGKNICVSNDKNAKEAITLYNPIRYNNNYSLLDVTLLTGRTHQIRVHMSYIGHPVIGDSRYGDYTLNKEIDNNYHFVNQFLFANKIEFGKITGIFSYLCNKTISVKLNHEMEDLLDTLLPSNN